MEHIGEDESRERGRNSTGSSPLLPQLTRGQQQGHDAGLRDLGNEWRRLAPGDRGNAGQRPGEDPAHLRTLQVPRCEHEHADGGHADRGQRGSAITNSSIFGENDPTSLADLTQPVFVGRRRWEVIVVNLDLRSGESQGCGDNLVTKGTVDEENKRFRRLVRRARTGSRLQSPAACDRSRRRGRPPIRRPCSVRQ